MIPKTICYKDLLKTIDYVTTNGQHINFICETPDLSAQVKRAIVTKTLDSHKKNKSFLKGNVFINVDPNYYDSFFANTPDNKNLWHKYDYSSNYEFRRKAPESLSVLIGYYLAKFYDEEKNSYNYEQIEEALLGTYNSICNFNKLVFSDIEIEALSLKQKENFNFFNLTFDIKDYISFIKINREIKKSEEKRLVKKIENTF